MTVESATDRGSTVSIFRRAQKWLRHDAASPQAALLEALPAHVAVLDRHGVITSVNEAWRRSDITEPMHAPGPQLGRNYLEIRERMPAAESSVAQQISAGVRSVLDGAVELFSMDYVCNSSSSLSG